MAKKELKLNYNTFATTHSRDYYRGQSFHFSGEWLVGAHYLSDDYNVDFVVHDQVLLACAKSHLSTTENEPKDFIRDESGTVVGVVSTYWDFVLSGIVGKSPGIKIIDNYWYTCANTGVPEEEQIWVNTGVKAKMELSDLTPADIELLQRPGKEVVTEFVNTTITQELGNDPTKILSQAGVTTALNTKASLAQLNAAIQNEVLRANNTYQSKGDYATNTRVNELESTITDLEDDITDDIDDINDAISDIQSDIDTLEGNIPTKVSQLENDSRFQTRSDVDGLLTSIKDVIPQAATSVNQLADKNYVNSNIAASTANFQGTSEPGLTQSEFEDWLETLISADANDYVYWNTTDSVGNVVFKRYKYNGSQWIYEYDLNNSSFTSDEWAAIQSGITSNLVTAFGAKYDKPSGGIPKEDLSSSVQTSLGKADTALQQQDIADKVDKIPGKGLSTEDYTTDEKNKLSGIEAGAEENVLEGVQVNGTDLSIASKKVNIDLSGKVDIASYVINQDNEFVYRKTGDGLNIDAEHAVITKVRGKSLVWNQNVSMKSTATTQKDVTVTPGTNSLFTINGTASGDITHTYYFSPINTMSIPDGHKVYIGAFNGNGKVALEFLGLNHRGSFVSVSDAMIYTAPYGVAYTSLIISSGTSFSNETYRFPNFVDLTLMFGAGNEPSTVAEFEALYPLPYYAYNAGEIISNKTEQVKVVGFNQWDEETRPGYYNANGVYVSQTEGINIYTANKNSIPVFPSTLYYLTHPGTLLIIVEKDINGNVITRRQPSGVDNTGDSFTVSENTYFLDFCIGSAVNPIHDVNHDTCLNISNTPLNGTYEPYKTNTIELNLPTLTGKVNGEGESVVLCADGAKSAGSVYDEFVVENGYITKFVKRIGNLNLGGQDVTWGYNSSYGFFITLSDMREASTGNPLKAICGKYSGVIAAEDWSTYDKVFLLNPNTLTSAYSKRLFIRDSSYSDASTFKTAMSGVILNYELGEPLTYILDNPIDVRYLIDVDGTERRLPEDTSSTVTAPFRADIQYNNTVVNDLDVKNILDYAKQKDLLKTITIGEDVYNINKGNVTLPENAATATKLENSVTLWGQTFDGSDNISGALSSVTDIAASGELSGNAFKVIAEHITRLTSRLDTLESSINTLGDVTVKSLDVRKDILHNGSKLILAGSGAPTTVPDFVGQFYIDITNKKLYFAVSTSAVSSWTVC